MRVLLVLLAIVMVMPFQADARRRQRVIVVYDYTSAAWDGVVAQTVEDFNAVLPRWASLRYERGQGACQQAQRVVALCSDATALNSSVVESFWNWRRKRLAWAVIVMTDRENAYTGFDQRRAVLCHELMHALTGIPDDYGARPDDSCVHGYLTTPGPFDVAYLRQTYKRNHR